MKDPAVRDVRWRIEAIPSAELTAARPARQAIVEIDCADGRRLSHRTRTVLGTPDNPMTEAQVEAKSRDPIAPVLGDTQTDAPIAALRDLESQDYVRKPNALLPACTPSRNVEAAAHQTGPAGHNEIRRHPGRPHPAAPHPA